MSSHKAIDRICCAVLVLVLAVTVLLFNAEALGITAAERVMGYETRLFDTERVHTLEIVMDDWDSFIETCENEEYAACTVLIDNEAYKNVGIRAKGNTSLSSVSSMNSDRYSFKIEFDQYESGKSYHGLDKLSLNNIIQDNTYMKDYLTYRMMAEFGVDAPLCSFVYITVNGEDWGLYLAVEGVEDAFLQRNYGTSYGDLYKPDSLGMGGGRGNGMEFDMEDFMSSFSGDSDAAQEGSELPLPQDFDPSSMFGGESGGGFDPSSMFGGESAEGFDPSSMRGEGKDFGNMGGMSMGSSDVKLQYIDEDPDSYSTIFDSAKTNVTAADKTRLIASLKQLGEMEDLDEVLDIDEVLRYFVVHNYVCNGDSYTGSMIHNYYLYEEDGRFSMIPWDYNLAFGTFQGSDATDAVNDPIDTPLSVTGSGDRPMIDWIWSSKEYAELYHAYFADFLNSVDTTAIIDEAYVLIAPYVAQDPTKFCTTEEFESGVAALREFCTLRTQSVRGQLDGSIPSTSDGQKQNSAALVDASHLSLSDMGTMGNTMMGGGNRGDMTRPSGERDSTTSRPSMPSDESTEVPEMPADRTVPETTTETPEATTETSVQVSAAAVMLLSIETAAGEESTAVTTEAATQASEIPQMPTDGMPSGELPTGEMPTDGSFPQIPSASSDGTQNGGFTRPDSMGNAMGDKGSMQMPGNMGTQSAAVDSTAVLLGVSVAVLALGLVIAYFFKPRSW